MKPKPQTQQAYQLFHDGAKALAQIEQKGLKIDLEYLRKTTTRLEEKVRSSLELMKADPFFKKWRRRFGSKANIGSGHQLGVMLSAEGFKTDIKTNKGADSWNEKAISKIDLPFLRIMNRWKKDHKVLSTYFKGMEREIDSKGYVHPFFKLASGGESGDEKGGARSYRSSSAMHNFQNQPQRDLEMQALVRPLYIPPSDDWHFGDLDFSQLEVRTSCGYNKDPVLIRYIKDPSKDMHRDTAMELFCLKQEQVWKKTTRDIAKNQFVFPQFYGAIYWKCAPEIWDSLESKDRNVRVGEDGMPMIKHLAKHGIKELGNCDPDYIKQHGTRKGTFVHHVKKVQESFWNDRFPVYTKWKQDYYNEYVRRGWFASLTGFRYDGYYRRNQVINFANQGSAFHCLLWSIIEIQKKLKKKKMRSYINGEIHDSHTDAIHKNEVQDFLNICKRVMTVELPKAFTWINVPLEIEADLSPLGKSWHHKQQWIPDESGIWGIKA